VRNTVANWEERCAYLTHPKTVSALECYLNHRIARDMGTELTAERYRGLAPSSCLVLAGKVRKFAMNTKRRINEAGEQVDYSACDSLQSRVTKLYRDAEIRGGSSHSGLYASEEAIIFVAVCEGILGRTPFFASGQ
jgi:integrase/recombinase XerD